MDVDDLSNFWAKFQVAFSWDYPEGWDIQTIQSAIFHVVGDSDTRAQDQLVVGCVQSAGAGANLTHPKPETENVPCELSFTAHPMAQQFCIKSIDIVSEARNVELYVDDRYERTAKGIMLTIKKGRKTSLFETEFDLSEFIHGTCRCLLKFVSFPDRHSIRLQTIVVRVAKGPPPAPPKALRPGQVDMAGVRAYLDSLGKPLTADAERILDNIEQMQMVTRPRSSSLGSRLRAEQSEGRASEGSILAHAMSRARQLEEDDRSERMDRKTSNPEEDPDFVHMLAHLMEGKTERGADDDGASLVNGLADQDPYAKQRWEAYLQSRLRTSRNLMRKPRPSSLVSTASAPVSFSSSPGALSVSGRAQSLNMDERRSLDKGHDSPGVDSGIPKMSALKAGPKIRPPPSVKSTKSGGPRCSECGCPGCLSVYNSITTSVFAAEERIMGRVETRMQQLLDHMNARFDALYDSCLPQADDYDRASVDGADRMPTTRKYSAQRNGRKADTSV